MTGGIGAAVDVGNLPTSFQLVELRNLRSSFQLVMGSTDRAIRIRNFRNPFQLAMDGRR